MRLSKEMVNTIKKVDINDIINYVDEHVKDIYVSAHYSSLQGWHYDLLLDENGDLDIAGPFSTGGMCMSTYKGTDIVLTRIPAYFEMDNFFTTDVISNSLNEDEEKELFEKCLRRLDWDIEDLDEGYNLYDLYYEDICTVEQVYQEIYEEKYEDLEKEYIEGEWDYFFRDNLIERIENSLDEIKKYINEDNEDYI